MSTPVSTSFNAWRRVSKTERVTIRERGRICEREDCDTILSIYNPARYCSAHVSAAPGSRRRGTSLAARAVPCAHCGEEFETRNAHRKYCSDRCRMAAFAHRKRAAERNLLRLARNAAEPGGPQPVTLVQDAAW